MRAFKSKTPPLLVDTTVLFPPKKGQKTKEEEDFVLRILFYLVFRYLDLRLLCSSLLLSVYSLSALVLVCSTNVERTREAPSPPDTSNWLLPSTRKLVMCRFFFFFLETLFKSSFHFSSLHSVISLFQSKFLSNLFSPFCGI